jgi:hypothetical protein
MLCRRHNIELYDYANYEGELPSYAIEASQCTMARSKYGPPTIFLGVYKNPELRLISFFHELGHIVDVDNRRIPKYEDLPYYHFSEASAWRMGFRLAYRNGVEFSQEAIDWAKTQLASYFEDDNPEQTPVKYLPIANKYAFEDERLNLEKALAA